MNFKILRPGIVNLGTRLKPESWRAIEPGDELWFMVSHGAEGTDLGSVNWYLIRDNKVLSFGFGDKSSNNTEFVFGWPLPHSSKELKEKRIQKKLSDILWTVQVLVSAISNLPTELSDAAPLDEEWSMKGERFAVLKFLAPTT